MLLQNVQVQSENECHVHQMNVETSSMEYAIAGSGSGMTEMEFWPLEHPTEPSAEDQPVKCPMSHHSSAINVGKGRSTETLKKKRVKSTAKLTRSRSETVIATGDGGSSTAIRQDRKRHHTLTHGDIVITPIIRPVPKPAPDNSAARELTTILQPMLHRTDHSSFEPAM